MRETHHMCDTCVSWSWQHITQVWETANGFESIILIFRLYVYKYTYMCVRMHIYIYTYIHTLNIRIMDSNPLAVSHTCVICCQAQLTHVWCIAGLNSHMCCNKHINNRVHNWGRSKAAPIIDVFVAAHVWVEPGNTSHMCELSLATHHTCVGNC